MGVSNTARTTVDSGSNTGVQPDARTWVNTWEMMNRTLEAFALGNTESSDRVSGKSRKTFKNLRNSRMIQMVALIHGLR